MYINKSNILCSDCEDSYYRMLTLLFSMFSEVQQIQLDDSYKKNFAKQLKKNMNSGTS